MWGGFSTLQVLILLGLILLAAGMIAVFKLLGQIFPPPNPRILQYVIVSCIAIGFLLRRQIGQALNSHFDKIFTAWPRTDREDEEA